MDNLNKSKFFLEQMNQMNQIQFLQLLISHNIDYSENKNGSFLNLSELDSIQCSIIQQFINKTLHEQNIFNNTEKTKQQFKEIVGSSDYLISK
jgi:hypothetical protein